MPVNSKEAERLVLEILEEIKPVLESFIKLDYPEPEPEHAWEHGDVFENCVGKWIYLEPRVGDRVVTALTGKPDYCGTPGIQLKGEDVKFLFNIKEKL